MKYKIRNRPPQRLIEKKVDEFQSSSESNHNIVSFFNGKLEKHLNSFTVMNELSRFQCCCYSLRVLENSIKKILKTHAVRISPEKSFLRAVFYSSLVLRTDCNNY